MLYRFKLCFAYVFIVWQVIIPDEQANSICIRGFNHIYIYFYSSWHWRCMWHFYVMLCLVINVSLFKSFRFGSLPTYHTIAICEYDFYLEYECERSGDWTERQMITLRIFLCIGFICFHWESNWYIDKMAGRPYVQYVCSLVSLWYIC